MEYYSYDPDDYVVERTPCRVAIALLNFHDAVSRGTRRCCWCRLPRYDTLAFLLLHAGYVSQWAFDYRFYQAGGLSLVDVGIVVAVQQVALVLGRIIPLTRMPCPSWKLPCVRIPRGLRSFAPLALVIATMAKARGHFYAAAAAQGFLVSAIAEAVCPIDDVEISVWQGCASHAIWTLVAVQVDYLRFDIGTVYLTAAGCYAAVVICLLMVGRSGRRRCCSSLAKRVFRERDTTRGSSDEDDGDSASSPRDALSLPRLPGQSLNSRLLWLAFYAESSSRVAMTVSSVSLQTAAILVRVAFPAVVEVPCYQYVPSLPILLVVRLLLEQLAASQASRWPQSCGRLVFLFSGYIVSSMALLLHFQTYVHQGDLCALHMMLAYATSLSCVAGAVRPVWETHLAGFISAAMLVWPVGRIGQFDATLAWASLALMLGCSAATISLAASLFRPTGMHVRFRRRQPARLR
ncbi:uncharacterized protein LOC119405384 [Rhipicephalus sanguineus]|uniref:uncharacterized protein LOC119405384 n=1 Tax=Rhipicephalus sanguineus TaxID=34632 RepID=UPI00189480D4|nr:uncharacterized protein LOC119405384 [Rhipicephalus sanguineus]